MTTALYLLTVILICSGIAYLSYWLGKVAGKFDGYDSGHQQGIQLGYDAGRAYGWQEGYFH